MRALSTVLALALATAPALRSRRAAADPHPMASGATPAPTTETQVAMTGEDLHIVLDLRTAAVEAKVTLVNRGPATRLTVGFPCATGDDAGAIDVPCKVPLAVTVGGKKQKLKRVKTSKTVQHWTWPLALAAGQETTVVVRYQAPLLNERYSTPAFGMGLFTYRLTTGARWAGPIGDLHIVVEHFHEPLLFVSPAGYQRAPGRLEWHLKAHEPTDEVVLIPHPYLGNRLAGTLAAGGGKAARARLASGDYPRAAVDSVLADLRADDQVLDQWLPLIIEVGHLPAPPRDRAAAVVAESVLVLEGMAARATR